MCGGGRSSARRGTSAGREGGWYHSRPRTRAQRPPATRHTARRPPSSVASAPPCCGPWRPSARRAPAGCSVRASSSVGSWSSASSSPCRSRVVSPGRTRSRRSTLVLLGVAGVCYVIGLQLAYAAPDRQGLDRRADRRDRGRHRRRHRDRARRRGRAGRGPHARRHRGRRRPVALEPGRTDVAAGDFDVVIDAIDDRRPYRSPVDPTVPTATGERPSTRGARRSSRSGPRSSSGSGSSPPVARPRSCRSPGSRCRPASSASSSSSSPWSLQGRLRFTRRGAPAGRPRRRGRGPRFDAVGLGLAREHRRSRP